MVLYGLAPEARFPMMIKCQSCFPDFKIRTYMVGQDRIPVGINAAPACPRWLEYKEKDANDGRKFAHSAGDVGLIVQIE